MRISVTMLNDFDQLAIDGVCGLLFQAKYILKSVEGISSDAMRLGQYFEFMCTGAKLRDGSEPQPDVLKSGQLSAEYRRVESQVKHWKKFIDDYKIDMIEPGVVLTGSHNGVDLKGILDVLCTINGLPAIIDLKYSGQLDNKWDDYGWGHADIGGTRKVKQAVMYCYLYEVKYEYRPDFYFYVGSSTKEHERKIFRVKVTDRAIESLLKEIDYVASMIEYQEATGWTATKNYLNCIECPLKDTCEHCITTPEIIEVTA